MFQGRQLPLLIVIGCALIAYRYTDLKKFMPHKNKPLLDEYDYIIVGGGTSGCVLARRLAEDTDNTILVLEAGGDPSDDETVETPIFADRLRNSEYDWKYKTTKQKYACLAHEDGVSDMSIVFRACLWSLGKVLGGSSSIDYMQYLRGSRHDYDSWANNGAEGWSYKDVLPYFIKSENNQNWDFTQTVFHGYGGKMTINDINLSPVNKIAAQALSELGVKTCDINGQNQFGYSHTQATIKNGIRQSSFHAFLKNAMEWPNVYVNTYAKVQKIIFEGKKAVGVIYIDDDNYDEDESDDITKEARVTKEVILTAGTVGSAKILLLSGIGPRKHLNSLNIPVIADLPVGENLQDHVMSDGVEYTSKTAMTITPVKAENIIPSLSYNLFGTGLKMSPRYREGTAFIRTRNQPPHIRYPLIALHFIANVGSMEAEHVNINQELWNKIHLSQRFEKREGFTIYPVLLHPRSKGSLKLRSSNPSDEPLINPNYLSHAVDIKILAEATNYARQLIKTKTFKKWKLKLDNKPLEQCQKHGNFTEDYTECHLRQITLPGRSPVGTCRLGADGDLTTVVNPILQVRGLESLRVVDASIIPKTTSGNMRTTQIMLAEKGADLIMGRDSVKKIKKYLKHMIIKKAQQMNEAEEIALKTMKVIT